MDNYSSRYVIIGAGVAGLSAAMRLLDFGIHPLLIDGASFPCHKVCGEFFSPECLPLLSQWNMSPALLIDQVHYTVGHKQYCFKLPESAGSESRHSFDFRMIQAIQKRGGEVRLNTNVIHIDAGRVVLSSGEELFPKALFMGTGRKVAIRPDFPYRGIKGHLSGVELKNTLEMHLFPGAYLGISPVEGGRVNIACLVDKKKIGNESAEVFMKKILNERLNDSRILWPSKWLEVEAPTFGIVSSPFWRDTYFIGDAAARIPPSSGGGLATAVLSGVRAAEHAVTGDWMGYRTKWEKALRRRIFWDRPVHFLMMRSSVSGPLLGGLQKFPLLFSSLFEKTRFVFSDLN